jgi:hypothetical protein
VPVEPDEPLVDAEVMRDAAPAALAAPEAAAVVDAPAVGSAPEAAAVDYRPAEAAVVSDSVPAAAGASAIEAEVVVTPEDLAGDQTCTPRVAGSPLAGPTLDDVMSRVWEGLVTGLPAACPACHGEVLPSAARPLSGRCTSCGTTIE